uniref:CAZy families GH51 protein n=1 Tax=uncultured Beutenbergia sp. TaxID=1434397 RepID=A0A060C6W3_9MICO|nr:CAZy families GH51 protein [uncultured Beutenbergia sp.]
MVYADPLYALVGRMRSLAGYYPVAVQTHGPGYDVHLPTDLGLPARGIPYVDISCMVAPDGDRMVVIAVK